MEGMEEDGDMSPEMAEMMSKGMADFAGQENMEDLGKAGGLEKMMRTMGADAVFDGEGELDGDSDDELGDDDEAMAAMLVIRAPTPSHRARRVSLPFVDTARRARAVRRR